MLLQTSCLFKGYHQSPPLVISLLLWLLFTSIPSFTSANERVHYTVKRIAVDPNQARLLGPISLTLGPWFALSKRGITAKTPECGLKLELEALTIRHHHHHFGRVNSLKLCTVSNSLHVLGLQATIGRVQLNIDKLEVSLPTPETVVVTGINAQCGRYLPLHLSTRTARYDGGGLILRDSTLRFHGLPIGWFPQFKVSETGHSGLLPPTVSFGRNEFRVGLPLYWLVTSKQALTLTPGYRHQSETTQHLFANALYEWQPEIYRSGQIRALLQSETASISGHGKAHAQHWRINLYGNSVFGTSALSMDPRLDVSALTGYSRGGLTLNRLDEHLNFGVRIERAYTDPALDNITFLARSQSTQFASMRHAFEWGQIALYNRSITQWEPEYRWLSNTVLELDIEQRWWLFRLHNHSQARVQHDARTPLFQRSVFNHGLPSFNEALTLESLWRRSFDGFTHTIGLTGDGLLNYRLSDGPNQLDTQTPPGSRRNARARVGIKSMTDQMSGMTSLSAHFVYLSQSETTDDSFFETDAEVKYQNVQLSLYYAYERSILINGIFDLGEYTSFRTTYFERSEQFVPIDLLDPMVRSSAPTVGYHLGTKGHRLELTGAAWTTPTHTTFQAGTMRLSHLAQCECVRWTTEAKYLRHRQNFWLTFGIEFDVDTSRNNTHHQLVNPISSLRRSP